MHVINVIVKRPVHSLKHAPQTLHSLKLASVTIETSTVIGQHGHRLPTLPAAWLRDGCPHRGSDGSGSLTEQTVNTGESSHLVPAQRQRDSFLQSSYQWRLGKSGAERGVLCTCSLEY